MVWAYPVLVETMTVMQDGTHFSWLDILQAWEGVIPFFLLFLLHRFPVYRLLLRHRVRAYFFSALALLALFVVCRYFSMDVLHGRHPAGKTYHVQFDGHPPEHDPFMLDGKKPPVMQEQRPDAGHRPRLHEKHRPAPFGIPGKITLDLIIAMLMLGFDIAIVLLSRSQEEEERKSREKATHKEQELEHLKAQLNPHFFMNMLNNIHGMVEMDSRLAQEMIIELSHLMRYVLYEGAKPYTTLQHEKEFIGNYVGLMRKRCSDTKVCIGMHLPEESLSHIRIPPLLFISIIENAFKHGISYLNSSFVEMRMSYSEHNVTLECLNSVHPKHSRQDNAEGGIGLANLRQRLQLLYGDMFNLEIENTEIIYHVILTIPCEYENDKMPCN